MKLTKAFLFPTLIAWLLWFAFSLYYGFDRLYGDSAFYLFDVINELKFSIAHQRPAGYLIEFIPLILAKNNASMEQIILWFSLNESIVLISISVLGSVLVKDVRMGLAIMLPFFLGDRYNYFNPVSELLLAAPLFVLFFGLLFSKGEEKWVQLLFLPFVVFVVYSHPLYYILLPLVYGLIILLKKVPLKWNVIHGLFIIITLLVRYFTTDEYDKKQLEVEHQLGFSEIANHFLNSGSTLSLLQAFAGLMLMLLLSIFIIFKHEKKIISIYSIGVFGALVGVVIYKYSALFPDTMEPFERYLFPASIFVSLLFYFSSFHMNKWAPWFIGLVIVYQSLQLFSYGKKVKDRNFQLGSLIEYGQQHHYSKVTVKYHNFNPTRLGHDWIMTNESLLLSRIVGNKKNVQVSVHESVEGSILNEMLPNQFVYFPWWCLNVNTLNPEYFNVYAQPLKTVNTFVDTLDIKKIDFSKFNVELLSTNFKSDKSNIRVKINLVNNGQVPLYSGLEKNEFHLSYDWRKNGEIVEVGGSVPLLADLLPGSLKQLILLNTPTEAGLYDLAFYFEINENERIFVDVSKSIQVE